MIDSTKKNLFNEVKILKLRSTLKPRYVYTVIH